MTMDICKSQVIPIFICHQLKQQWEFVFIGEKNYLWFIGNETVSEETDIGVWIDLQENAK